MELAGSLLSASSSRGQSTQAAGLTGEMIRFMRASGVINALISALKLVEMDHPEVSYALLFPITPPIVLCRAWLLYL